MSATADVRKLKGMVAKPGKRVTVADMNRAIEAESGRIKNPRLSAFTGCV